MSLFDRGAGTNTGSFSGSFINTGRQVLGGAGRLAGALSNLSNPSMALSQLRSRNLPVGGNTSFASSSAGAQWSGSESSNDWRVRLSLPTDPTFSGSPVLQPLVAAGGMVFPYTPQISISGTASYDEQALTHQNYTSVSYQNSKQDSIQITAPFFVEDAVQAQYWLAAVHYFRSITKMYTGDVGEIAGNPPPVVLFNGYGDYVFKNIPVVVKTFSVELPADANYIATTVGKSSTQTSPTGNVLANPVPLTQSFAQRTAQLAGLAGALGASQLAQVLGVGAIASSAISSLRNARNNNPANVPTPANLGTFGGASHVPVKSSFTITLTPIYSRQSMRKFNLNTFISGGYVNNNVGYL
jgi:hypothetical protein